MIPESTRALSHVAFAISNLSDDDFEDQGKRKQSVLDFNRLRLMTRTLNKTKAVVDGKYKMSASGSASASELKKKGSDILGVFNDILNYAGQISEFKTPDLPDREILKLKPASTEFINDLISDTENTRKESINAWKETDKAMDHLMACLKKEEELQIRCAGSVKMIFSVVKKDVLMLGAKMDTISSKVGGYKDLCSALSDATNNENNIKTLLSNFLELNAIRAMISVLFMIRDYNGKLIYSEGVRGSKFAIDFPTVSHYIVSELETRHDGKGKHIPKSIRVSFIDWLIKGLTEPGQSKYFKNKIMTSALSDLIDNEASETSVFNMMDSNESAQTKLGHMTTKFTAESRNKAIGKSDRNLRDIDRKIEEIPICEFFSKTLEDVVIPYCGLSPILSDINVLPIDIKTCDGIDSNLVSGCPSFVFNYDNVIQITTGDNVSSYAISISKIKGDISKDMTDANLLFRTSAPSLERIKNLRFPYAGIFTPESFGVDYANATDNNTMYLQYKKSLFTQYTPLNEIYKETQTLEVKQCMTALVRVIQTIKLLYTKARVRLTYRSSWAYKENNASTAQHSPNTSGDSDKTNTNPIVSDKPTAPSKDGTDLIGSFTQSVKSLFTKATTSKSAAPDADEDDEKSDKEEGEEGEEHQEKGQESNSTTNEFYSTPTETEIVERAEPFIVLLNNNDPADACILITDWTGVIPIKEDIDTTNNNLAIPTELRAQLAQLTDDILFAYANCFDALNVHSGIQSLLDCVKNMDRQLTFDELLKHEAWRYSDTTYRVITSVEVLALKGPWEELSTIASGKMDREMGAKTQISNDVTTLIKADDRHEYCVICYECYDDGVSEANVIVYKKPKSKTANDTSKTKQKSKPQKAVEEDDE